MTPRSRAMFDAGHRGDARLALIAVRQRAQRRDIAGRPRVRAHGHRVDVAVDAIERLAKAVEIVHRALLELLDGRARIVDVDRVGRRDRLEPGALGRSRDDVAGDVRARQAGLA